MAQHFDEYDKSIVIDGWQNGIADDPYSGLSDMRNCNIISIPGETSVQFSVAKNTDPNFSNIVVTSADAGTNQITFSGATNLATGQAIQFASGVTIGGASSGITYWIHKITDTTAELYTDYTFTPILDITSNGTGTFSTINMGIPKYFTKDEYDGSYYLVDNLGQVWSNLYLNVNPSWTFTGNIPNLNKTAGNGLMYYQSSNPNSNRYLFLFNNGSIDYCLLGSSGGTWYYEWIPTAGTKSNTPSVNPTQTLNTTIGDSTAIHECYVDTGNVLYYCDGSFLGSFFEVSGKTFSPIDTTTYTYSKEALILLRSEKTQCLTQLGLNLLIGGKGNIIYQWDRQSAYASPIFLAESNIQKMLTINTNTYCLVGQRGRIYTTNGSQAVLWKKIPDHISGTVEPYFTWGCMCSTKNQIYFSFSSTTNDGTPLTTYGGIWAIDVDTKALRLTHKLSFATYAGLATAIIPYTLTSNNGTGLYIGWNDGASGYGIDKTVSYPYSSDEATIDSDLIPIGTYERPRNATRIEYKLTKPLVNGESITIKYRSDFSQSYTTVLKDTATATYTPFSKDGPINFSNAQWCQFQIVLDSVIASPSYVRLKEIRIKGLSQ